MHFSVAPASAPAALASVSNGLVRGPSQWFAGAMPAPSVVGAPAPAPQCAAAAAIGLVRTQAWR